MDRAPFIQDANIDSHVYSVQEISTVIRRHLETSFNPVRVRGEISSLTVHRSGHIYFSLKEDETVLDAVVWRGIAAGFSMPLQEGMSIIARGRITTHGARSKYQFLMDGFELEGIGAMMRMLHERRERLAAQGLFDQARKKPLPIFPTHVGLITSPQGAVIHDMMVRLTHRFVPHVMLWPVAVQGEKAVSEMVNAIQGFHNHVPRPDVIILARGGGSFEDLWPFQDEDLIRAVAASSIPIITAIGHETDTPLVDLASDRRAPTPTAAADMVAPRIDDLRDILGNHNHRAYHGLRRLCEQRTTILSKGIQRLGRPWPRLDFLQHRLSRIDMGQSLLRFHRSKSTLMASFRTQLPPMLPRIARVKDHLQRLTERLDNSIERLMQKGQTRVNGLYDQLKILSFGKTLDRGFAVIEGPKGVISSAQPFQSGQSISITIRFHDGAIRGDFIPSHYPKDIL